MNVKDLIKKLSELPKEFQEAFIILSSDPEGNSYSLLWSITTDMVFIQDPEFEVGFPELTDELEDDGYGEGDILENGIKCIVLYPE